MKRKANFLNRIQQLRTHVRLAVHYSWIGLLFFVFLLKNTSAFADYSGAETLIEHSSVSLFSTPVQTSQIVPFHLPFTLDLSQQVKEAPDENDFEEDIEEECSLLAEPIVVQCYFNALAANFSFGATPYALQNRSSVPFFILYHSWKSFIA